MSGLSSLSANAQDLYQWIARYIHTNQLEDYECPSMDICYAYLKHKGWSIAKVESAFNQLQERGVIRSSDYIFSRHLENADDSPPAD